MTTEQELELEIRRALEAEAEEIEVPEDLADRTLAVAREEEPSFLERARARRDARRADGGRVTGYPRWAYAGAAALLLVAFVLVGGLVTTESSVDDLAGPVATSGSGAANFEGDASATTGRQGDDEVQQAGQATSGGGSAAGSQVGGPLQQRGSGEEGSGGSAPEPDIAEPPLPQPDGSFPPKLVRTADVDVEVSEGRFDDARRRAEEIVRAHEGVVTGFSTTETPDDGLARGTLTLRIPAERLDAALGEFRDLGSLTRLETTGFDVSGRLTDLDARIRNAEAQEARLLELLDEAEDLSQTLEIRERLDDARREIEELKTQEENLENEVAFSTVRLTLFEPGQELEEDTAPDGRLEQAIERGVEIAATVLAGMVVIGLALAPLVALAALLWGAVRLRRRRSAE